MDHTSTVADVLGSDGYGCIERRNRIRARPDRLRGRGEVNWLETSIAARGRQAEQGERAWAEKLHRWAVDSCMITAGWVRGHTAGGRGGTLR